MFFFQYQERRFENKRGDKIKNILGRSGVPEES